MVTVRLVNALGFVTPSIGWTVVVLCKDQFFKLEPAWGAHGEKVAFGKRKS